MSSPLRAIVNFNPIAQVYLDVAEGQQLVSQRTEGANSWPEESRKRVIEYLHKNPLEGKLNLDFLNLQTSKNLSYLLSSLGSNGNKKVEFEMFKFLMRNASSSQLSEFQLSTLCLVTHGQPFEYAVNGARFLSHIPDDKFENACQKLLLIQKNGYWDLVSKVLSNDNIEFYLEVAPKLVIGLYPDRVLETIERIRVSGRNDVIKYSLEIVKDDDDPFGHVSKILDTLVNIEKSDLDDVLAHLQELNLPDNLQTVWMIVIISLIPAKDRDINTIRAFYNESLENLSDTLDKKFDLIIKDFQTIPEMFRERAIKIIPDLINTFTHKIHTDKIIARIASIFETDQKAGRSLPAALIDELSTKILRAIIDTIPALSDIKYPDDASRYLRMLALVNEEERHSGIFKTIIKFLDEISSSIAFEDLMFVFRKVPRVNRNLEILKSIQTFTKIEDTQLRGERFRRDTSFVVRLMHNINGIEENELGWVLKRASDLVLMYGVWDKLNQFKILNAVIKDSENAHLVAENLRRSDQVQLASNIMKKEPDAFDQMMKQFIEEIELYLPFCDDTILNHLIQFYSKELEETLEQRFENMTPVQQKEMVPLMLPTQVKRYFDQETILHIMNETSDSHSKFCAITMNSPEVLYDSALELDSLRFMLFLRVLDKDKLPKLITIFSNEFADQVSTLEQLLQEVQSGEDVSYENNTVRMWCTSMSPKIKALQDVGLKSNLEQEVRSLLALSKNAKKLIKKIEQYEQEIPQKFIDALTSLRMKDPVKVPKSDVYVDQSTLYNPKYFEVEVRSGITYRKNPINTLFYPDYTTSKTDSQELGYEIDESLRQEIQKHFEALRFHKT